MKKILVLTDFSENSANAYRYAARLACQVQAHIQLVFSSNGLGMSLQDFEQFPILWVPDKASFQAPKQLVYVTDYTDQDPAIVDQVKSFAHLFQAEVTLIHFFSPADRVRLAQIKKEGEVLHQIMA